MSLGLSAKEAAVYTTLLSMGRSTVSAIARKSLVNRATAYVVLDSLVGKGLVQISGKEPKQEYVAESPNKLASLYRDEAKKAERRAERAASLALELTSIQKVGTRPHVKFYEGIDGLKQVYEDTLTATGPILACASVEDVAATLGSFYPAYIKRRAKKKIFAKGIIPKTPMAIERCKHDAEEARETVFVPAEEFDFHPEINIYDNKVMVASWREKLGIIIESAEIAYVMKKLYGLAWERAKQLEGEAKKKTTGR
jgi:sugar-specific transcriptional regulator TrmB